ncbi:protein pygopus [Aplysia californica]|uniref:Protein pygopus n=1 Tax=Aplysia californica TaxID=6500 RepID=A0ABM0JBA0_APLCA|nr:protein pygopus [Aplysia californica]XP_035825459.1 protein pygopus [Aplysia californica]
MRIPHMDDKKSSSSQQKNTLAELLPGPSPPPVSTSASNIVAQNPFDDVLPSSNSMQPKPQQQLPPPHSQPQPGSLPPGPGPGPSPHGKIYPPNQPMVFNPSNPSAPPIYPCGVCHKEVHENDQAVLCESGCNFWFHRMCAGLSHDAFSMLKAEVYAEWVCDRCLNTKEIPLVKLKP